MIKRFWDYTSKHPLWSAIIAAAIIKAIGWLFNWSLNSNMFEFIYSIHLPNWLSATLVVNVLSITASIIGIYASLIAIRSYRRSHEPRRKTFKKFEKRFEKAKTDDEKFSLLDEVTNKMSAVIKDYEKATSDNSISRLNEVIETDSNPIPPKQHPNSYNLEVELKNEMTAGRTIDIKPPPLPAQTKPVSLADILTGRWQHEYTVPSGYKGPETLIEIKEDKWYEDHIHKFNIEDFSIAEDKTSMNFSKVSFDRSFRGVYILFTKDSKVWTGKESGYAKIKLTKVS